MQIIFHILTLFVLLNFSANSQNKKVVVITADCAIHPACADYIHTGIEKAIEENAECLIIKLNTPGGLLKSTRVIVTELLESPLPVVVYVSPSGSQAASAGVFITMAGHIAVMAPGTNIGAAHPVSLQGVQDSIMMEKATNDAAAFIRTISEKRKRNIEWGEDAVRKSLSITETEALELNVIDYVAKDLDELLEIIDGEEVELKSGKKIINTKNAEIITLEMTFAQKILSILSDPNIAYILLMLGIYGLFFELYNPGAIFPGVIGGICLILGFYSMHTLPINYAGLALIIFAVILFVLEIKVISHGILTVGGVISLALGSMMLIKEESVLEAMAISMELIILVVVLTAAFFLFAISLGIKAQRRKPTTGQEGIVGESGTAAITLNPHGKVKVHGEIWMAEAEEGIIKKGESVLVTAITGLKLKVKKIT
ncbi:MAG: nodulation protein NfeD [Ignavibacteriaceae bacterium]